MNPLVQNNVQRFAQILIALVGPALAKYGVEPGKLQTVVEGLGPVIALAWSAWQTHHNHKKLEAAKALPAGASNAEVAALAKEL